MIGPAFIGVIAHLALTPIQVPQDTLPATLAAAVHALASDSIEPAIRVAERYTQKAPRDPRGFLVLGDAYARRMPAGRFRALEAYRAAARLARRDPEPPYRMARMGLWLGGDDGERIAREELERVLELDPLYKDAWELWLTLYRNGGGRRKMVERFGPHRAQPLIRARIAQLLIEDEAYAEADRLLDSALAADATNPAWLGLSAQSALESGDTLMGLARYRRALAQASHDTGDVLWRQVIGIATPAELRAWSALAAEDRAAWLESFWARRNPNLFAGANGRIAEHFARLRYARKHFPLLHPLVTYHRNAVARALNLEPSEGERVFHLRCEVYQDLAPSFGLHVYLPGVSSRREASRVGMGALAHLTPEEREQVRAATESAIKTGALLPSVLGAAIQEEGSVAAAFAPPTFAALGFDVRNVDSTAGRVGYNLATGLDDRGLMYLRFGPPDRLLLGGDNTVDPQCATNELERWRYPQWGEVRFSRPSAFSRGLRTTPEMVFRPMNEEQFEGMKLGLTRDAPSVPAPLEFGVWTAHFRNRTDPQRTDLIVVVTRGEAAASVVGDAGGAVSVGRGREGHVTLVAHPGRYALLAHARVADTLGRQTIGVWVREYGYGPALSDLLVAEPWSAQTVDRDAMLEHVRRNLTFRSGESVRVYAELYGLVQAGGRVDYRAVYRLLKTDNPSRDIAREDWPTGTTFAFDRTGPAHPGLMEVETLDVDPRYLPPGTYLLRLEIRDNTAATLLGRSTIALVVR
jgi:cytochrome c-type biogenesis protein CcmH/NrfG